MITEKKIKAMNDDAFDFYQEYLERKTDYLDFKEQYGLQDYKIDTRDFILAMNELGCIYYTDQRDNYGLDIEFMDFVELLEYIATNDTILENDSFIEYCALNDIDTNRLNYFRWCVVSARCEDDLIYTSYSPNSIEDYDEDDCLYDENHSIEKTMIFFKHKLISLSDDDVMSIIKRL